MEGWVSFHRKIEEWEWYTDPNTFRLFFHLVLKANHKDAKWRGNDIKRGQLITSNDKLADSLKLSVQQIRTSLNKLKSTNEITIKATNKFTLVTIANYDLYQYKDDEITNKPTNNTTNEQQTNNKQITTNNNKNNKDNENTKSMYGEIFDYYCSLDLVKHRSLTGDMKKAIDKATKELGIDVEYMKRMLDRHSEKVNATVKSEYPIKKRPLAEFFGQKKYNSVSLICTDYLDENYTKQEVKSSGGIPLV